MIDMLETNLFPPLSIVKQLIDLHESIIHLPWLFHIVYHAEFVLLKTVARELLYVE